MAKAGEIRAGGLNFRETGILPLGSLPWGAHICLFYETEQDLIDANAGFFRAGLAGNEFCLWALPENVGRDQAMAGLRDALEGFDDHLAAGAVELIPGDDWYQEDEAFDVQRSLANAQVKLDGALARGFGGMRASGYAFWMNSKPWGTFRHYEEELSEWLSGKPMIGLCTYKLDASWATDLVNVARVHHFSIVLRRGKWEFFETPESAAVRRDNDPPHGGAIETPSSPFPGHDRLSPRERVTLTQIVNGASNKEAARALGISPRTVEFHRANIMRKLDARNVVELVGIVFGTG